MKKALIFIFFFLFTLSSYSQILPSHQASHYKSSSGAIQGVSATFTSCGPGSANLPISLGNAFFDSVPFFTVNSRIFNLSKRATKGTFCSSSAENN